MQAATVRSPGRQVRPRVLYVMGAGRSGSTILGVALGNCEDAIYAGELDAWLGRRGEPLLEDAERVEFWRRVRERVEGAEPLYGREAERTIERSLAALRVHRWRRRKRLRGPYRSVAESLYHAIAEVSGRTLIVDTSHYPLRARELQGLAGIELTILYLVRDPQGVVASFNNHEVAQYNKSTLTTNVYLWLTNLLAVPVFLRQPRERRLFVRHEDFLADPERVLAGILAHVGGSSPPPDLERLRTGVAFQGNRLLRAEVLALRREEMPPQRVSRLTSLLQLPWRAVFSRLQPVAAAREVRTGAEPPAPPITGDPHAAAD